MAGRRCLSRNFKIVSLWEQSELALLLVYLFKPHSDGSIFSTNGNWPYLFLQDCMLYIDGSLFRFKSVYQAHIRLARVEGSRGSSHNVQLFKDLGNHKAWLMRKLTQVQLQLLIGSVQYCSGPQTITFISSRTSRQVVAVRLNLAENYHSFIVVPLSNTRNHPRPHVILPLNILGCTYQSRTIFSLTVIPCPIQQNTINNTQLTLLIQISLIILNMIIKK